MNRLTGREQRLYDILHPAMTDVSIDDMHAAVWPDKDAGAIDTRRKQQELGCIVQGLNRKLPLSRVEPGEARRTYRLRSIA